MSEDKEPVMNNTNYPDKIDILAIVANAMCKDITSHMYFQRDNEDEQMVVRDLPRRRYNTEPEFKASVDATVDAIFKKFEEYKPKLILNS